MFRIDVLAMLSGGLSPVREVWSSNLAQQTDRHCFNIHSNSCTAMALYCKDNSTKGKFGLCSVPRCLGKTVTLSFASFFNIVI